MIRQRDPGSGRWGDLLELAADVRVAAPERRQAERTLVERLVGLSRGERISVARRATRPVLVALLGSAVDPEVARAALGNPRLVESDVVRLIGDPATRPAVLQTVADHDGWSGRRAIRLALVRNPRTPSRAALRALLGLDGTDLEALARDPSVPRLVRMRAERLEPDDADEIRIGGSGPR